MQVLIASIFWTSLGAVLFRLELAPAYLPKLLGRSLYWIGVPLQTLVLTRQSEFSQSVWLSVLVMGATLLIGFSCASFSWDCRSVARKWSNHLDAQAQQGSYILSSILGNVSFIGLSLVPTLVQQTYWGWIVLYSMVHTLFGSYGMGIVLASYFGQSQRLSWWTHIRAIVIAPSGWAFVLGWLTRDLLLPGAMEWGLKAGSGLVSLGAFLLIGIQLSQLQSIRHLRFALMPVALKILILPGLVGMGLSLAGVSGDARLALVLMAGMPTAFANVILAEEFNLDSQLAANSILLSTIGLPVTVFLWLALFR